MMPPIAKIFAAQKKLLAKAKSLGSIIFAPRCLLGKAAHGSTPCSNLVTCSLIPLQAIPIRRPISKVSAMSGCAYSLTSQPTVPTNTY